MSETRIILVVGATGTQGGATARHLQDAGFHVRALTRDPDSPKARALASLGAELVRGDLDDPASLKVALAGVDGLFSMQRPDDGSDSELRHGLGLIAAAREAGIGQIVHSSVCHVDEHEDFPGWSEDRWDRKYWGDKWAVEEAVRDAGFERWTILRPSFILENFLPPKVAFLFPTLREGRLLSPIAPDAPVQLIAGDDIGRFAAAAFRHPQIFDRRTLELASQTMTIGEIASTFSHVLSVPVEAISSSPEEALEAGQPAKWIRSQEWVTEAGYHIDISALDRFDVPMVTLADWIGRHRDEFCIAPATNAG